MNGKLKIHRFDMSNLFIQSFRLGSFPSLSDIAKSSSVSTHNRHGTYICKELLTTEHFLTYLQISKVEHIEQGSSCLRGHPVISEKTFP